MTKRARRPYKLTWCITKLMCLCVIQAQDELAGELGDGVGDDQESQEAIRQLTWCITILMCLCVIQAQDELAGELGDGVGDDQESREAIQAHLVYNQVDVCVCYSGPGRVGWGAR